MGPIVKLLLLLCALQASLFVFALAANSQPVLEPGLELYDEKISFNERRVYLLDKLIPGESYEVRTSSPGLYAAEFFVTLICDVDSLSPESSVGRKLLNVEKTMFNVDSAGRISKCASNTKEKPRYGVEIFARLEGVTTDQSLLSKPVSFNLAMDKLYVGVPSRAIPALIAMVILVAIALVFVWCCPSLWTGLTSPIHFKSKHH